MPPKAPLVPAVVGGLRLRVAALARRGTATRRQVCTFCSAAASSPFASPAAVAPRRPRSHIPARTRTRTQTQTRPITHEQHLRCFSSSTASNAADNVRAELYQTLVQLQEQLPRLVNPSRLQLALQGLRQSTGQEAVRVAVVGLGDGANTGATAARALLRALLCDPLQGQQEWETRLHSFDPARPLVVKVSSSAAAPHPDPAQPEAGLREDYDNDSSVQYLHISSPAYDGLGLEFILLTETALLAPSPETTPFVQDVEDSVLVPSVAVVRAADGRVQQQTPAPVHRAILVSAGLMGVVKLASLPLASAEKRGSDRRTIAAVVDITGFPSHEQLGAACPLTVVDTAQAIHGVDLFRQGPQNAMQYERLWSASQMPAMTTWLRAGLVEAEKEGRGGEAEAITKPAVRQLLDSIIQNAQASVRGQEAAAAPSSPQSTTVSKISPDHDTRRQQQQLIREGLDQWARRAHSELRDKLDLAFTGRRWRKLGWWKLFWHVDDVGMLTSEIVSQRFLPAAERELIFLAGRIAALRGASPPYPQPVFEEEPDVDDDDDEAPPVVGQREAAVKKTDVSAAVMTAVRPEWPGHIAFSRRYLSVETVPALQALAQRLLVQTLGASSAAATMAALLYASLSLAGGGGIYEAGALAGLGIVGSLGRMQRKWEAARRFWEGDVREEGRKAVRAVEASISTALEAQKKQMQQETSLPPEQMAHLRKGKELVDRAAELLARLK